MIIFSVICFFVFLFPQFIFVVNDDSFLVGVAAAVVVRKMYCTPAC
jgi:hypothetical protein